MVSIQQTADERRPVIQVNNLKAEFQTFAGTVNAVNGVSLGLNEGEILALVGESGCGKSVTALSLMGLISSPPGRVSGGEVWFDGRDLLKLSEKEMRSVRGNNIAMIFQDPMTSLNPVMTVGRQIAEVLKIHTDLGTTAIRDRAIELLEHVGVPAARERLDNYPHEFSGGMRQRVMIAMALSCNPKLLIADEPTTALDVTIQAQILDLIDRLRHELGMAVIMITHDLGVVARIADRVGVMYAGRIVEAGTVQDILMSPRHPYTMGLLETLPRLDLDEDRRLVPIAGRPPDLLDFPRGCPFQPRCKYAVAACVSENPALSLAAHAHEVACWVDVADDGQIKQASH